MKYLFIICIVVCLVQACEKEVEGCTNELAENYNPYARVNCCCVLDFDNILESYTGIYSIIESCNIGDYEYEISIERYSSSNEAILIRNFAGLDINIPAYWEEDRFLINEDDFSNGCRVQISGIITMENKDISIRYGIDFSPDNCAGIEDFECQAKESK